MNRSHPGHGFAARRPTKTPQQLRAEWVHAIELARTACAVAEGAGDGSQVTLGQSGGDIARLMVTVRDLASTNFPIEAFSARQMAGAFLALVQAFANPATGPEARTACAPFLRVGAEALDGLLSELRRQESRAWRSQTGERDD